jgi:multidrug efflux pump subunit AcrA (membrane-fusion protein)
MPFVQSENLDQHTDEIQDIITAPPSWLLRWGIMLFFGILVLIVGLSAIIRYPDILKTELKITTANSPKPIVAKISGRLVTLLAHENQMVDSGQILAYIESTANHEQVLTLLKELKIIQENLFNNRPTSLISLSNPHQFQLGEQQISYQNFYQSYLTYKATIEDGLYLKKKAFLQKELSDILLQKQFLLTQKELKEKEYKLAVEEYKMHEALFKDKIEAPAEFRKQESALLSHESGLQQILSAILTNKTTYSSKEKEIMELDNQIREEQSKFMQALNSLISEMEDWKSKYVLCASPKGNLSFTAAIQKDQFINSGQEVFYVNPGNPTFLGEMIIPQYNMGKVKEGQKVLIKLKSYPYEEYGLIEGYINYLPDVPFKDSIFISKVHFNSNKISRLKKPVILKNGMLADAEIITEDASLLHRLSRNMIKMIQ